MSSVTRTLSLAGLLLGLSPASLPSQNQDWMAVSQSFPSKYYVVRTDFPAEQAKTYAEHMDLACEAYLKMFQGLKPNRPAQLSLWLFRDQSSYNTVLSQQFNAVGTGSQGMCIPRGQSITLVGWKGGTSDQRVRELLQHEGFHQFASLLFSRIPTWANEGIAEVFERGVPIDGTLVVGEVSQADKKRLTAALEQNQFRSFADLFNIESKEWSQQLQDGNSQTNYLQAWSMAQFFLYAENGKYQPAFLKFLTLLNQRADPRPAWVTAFGYPNFDVMEEKWRAYITTVPATDYRSTIRRLEFLAAGMMHLSEQDVTAIRFEELKAELQKARFTHTSELFYEQVELSAADAANFEVPLLAEMQAAFQLVDSRGKVIEPGRRYTSKVPLRLVTTGMSPVNFEVSWKRKGRDYVPTFTSN